MQAKDFYYYIRPLIPRRLQIILRQQIVLKKKLRVKNIWPIDEKASNTPKGWSGWPNKKRFALILTHDVETERGHSRCKNLYEIEEKLGFRSSFNFVPERYQVSSSIRYELNEKGFEVGVHGLVHDGKLYRSKKVFNKRVIKINRYLKEWGAVGFRSPSMHKNLDWIHALNIKYDASTFDTDPFEPHAGGVVTIFPFWKTDDSAQKGYVELPYTLPQDFTLFVLMRKKNIDVWKKKLAWIVAKGGMVLMNTHPDYMSFYREKPNYDEYPAVYYEEFLNFIKQKYEGLYWHILPREMAGFWRNRNS